MKKKTANTGSDVMVDGKTLFQVVIGQYSTAPSLAEKMKIFKTMHSLYFTTLDMMMNDFAKYASSEDIFHQSNPKQLAAKKASTKLDLKTEPEANITDSVRQVMAMNAKDGNSAAKGMKKTTRKNLAEVNGAVAPKELLEGFWYDPRDKEDTKHLPNATVLAGERAFKGKKEFLDLLGRAKKRSRVAERYKGWSTCRICKCKNGSTELALDNLKWPEGYSHYVQAHNVKPSKAFVDALRKKFPQFTHAEIATRE